MKKTFTLLTMLLSIFMFANAQTAGNKLVFVDEDENELQNNATFIVNDFSETEGGALTYGKIMAIKNKTADNMPVTLKARVTNITGGEVGINAFDADEQSAEIRDLNLSGGTVLGGNGVGGFIYAFLDGTENQTATMVLELYTATANTDGTYTAKELQQTITLVFNKQTQKNNLVFVDKLGNVIEDGATIYLDNAEKDKFNAEGKVIHSGLSIRNIGEDNLFAMLKVDVEKLDEGASFQVCYPENCNTLDKVGDKLNTEFKVVIPEAPADASIDTEFKFPSTKPLMGVLNVQIYSAMSGDADEASRQPQAKVKLVFNSKATGVELLSANVAERYNVFNAQGMLIVGNAAKIEGLKQGVYVVQTLKNNKVVDTKKYIVK